MDEHLLDDIWRLKFALDGEYVDFTLMLTRCEDEIKTLREEIKDLKATINELEEELYEN